MPQNKVNNPEGKNQYTGSGAKKPLITGALARPPVNDGGYGSLSDIQQNKKQLDKAERKQMAIQDKATAELAGNLGLVRAGIASTAMLVGGTVAAGVKASGLGLKDMSYQDIWSNTKSAAVLAVSNSREKQQVESKFYDQAIKAQETASAAEKRYIRTLTKF